jgi:hypothetical protein
MIKKYKYPPLYQKCRAILEAQDGAGVSQVNQFIACSPASAFHKAGKYDQDTILHERYLLVCRHHCDNGYRKPHPQKLAFQNEPELLAVQMRCRPQLQRPHVKWLTAWRSSFRGKISFCKSIKISLGFPSIPKNKYREKERESHYSQNL